MDRVLTTVAGVGLDIAVCWRSSTPSSGSGGDIVEVLRLEPCRSAVLVGDVRGAGQAAHCTAREVASAIGAAMAGGRSPDEVLTTANAALRTVPAFAQDDELFATAVLAFAARRDESVELLLSSAGHPPPIIVRRDRVEMALVPGALLGAFDGSSYTSRRFWLSPGDVLILCTDGVTEARDRTGAFIGDALLPAALPQLWGFGAEDAADALVRVVVSHEAADRRRDDLAIATLTTRHSVLPHDVRGG